MTYHIYHHLPISFIFIDDPNPVPWCFEDALIHRSNMAHHVRATWPKAVLIFYWPSDWAMELQAVVDDMVLQKHPQPLP